MIQGMKHLTRMNRKRINLNFLSGDHCFKEDLKGDKGAFRHKQAGEPKPSTRLPANLEDYYATKNEPMITC